MWIRRFPRESFRVAFKILKLRKRQSLDEISNALLSEEFSGHSIINGAGILYILGGGKILSSAIFFLIKKRII